MTRPDWQLPAGVSRSLWEFAHDPQMARDEDKHLADAPLLDFDRQTLARWFPSPGQLADLGCGTGRLALDFARRGWSIVGVDLSPESLVVARERAREANVSLLLLRANLCDLGCLPSGYFDAVLLMFGTLGMISGAENRAAVLREAHRLLKPKGGLAIHVHNVWRHLFTSQGRRWLVRDMLRRLMRDETAGDTAHDYRGIPNMFHHSFTFGEVRRLLSANGFHLLESISLAPERDAPWPATSERNSDIEFRGWLKKWRATGWLVHAGRTP